MSGPVSDLMFQIIAKDQSRLGFDSASGNADNWARRNEAAARRVSASMKTSGSSVGNLAAQYQDIIVSAQMGTSAMTVGLQQGLQMAAVLGPMGAAGAVRGLGAAFMSLLSPVSLVTVGLSAAAAAAVQYFFNVGSEAEEADSALRQHAQQVDDLAKRWSDVPGLQEYAAAMKAAQQAAADASAAKFVTDEQWGQASAAVQAYIANLQSMQAELYQSNKVSESQILAISDAYDEVTTAIGDHNLKADQLVGLQAAVNSAFSSMGASVGAYQGPLSGLIGTLERVLGLNAQLANKVAFSDSTLPQLNPLGWSTPPELATDEDKLQTARANATKSQWQIEQERLARSTSGGTSESQNAYENAVQSLQERTRALEAQRAAQAGLNPLINDYGFALAKVQQSTDLLLAAEKAKLPISDELKASIEAQATAYATVTAEMNKQTAAAREMQQQIDFYKSSTASFITTFRQDWMEGASAIEAARNALSGFFDTLMTRIEQMAADKLITSLLGGFLGSSTSSTGTSFLSFLTGGASAFPAAPKLSAAALPVASQKMALDVNVGLKNEGLNIKPDVEVAARGEAEKAVVKRVPRLVKEGIEINNRDVLPGKVRKILTKPMDQRVG